MMAGATAEPSMSDRLWVAKMTLAFFLRSVFSHSRSWPEKPSIVERQPTLVDDDERRRSIEAVFDAVKQISEHRGGGVRADQTLGLEGLHRGGPKMFGSRRRAAVPMIPQHSKAAVPASGRWTAKGRRGR